MSIKIMTMVWDHAPARGITATDLLVLLRLADSANEETAMGWESIPTIATKVGTTDRTVQRCLRRLEQWSVIEAVPEAERPAEASRYRSVPRRILPVDQWDVVDTDTNSEVGTRDEGDPSGGGVTNCHPRTRVSPNPNYTTTTGSSQSLETASLKPSMGVTAQSYSKPKGSKAKRAAAEAEAEQRAFDYSTLLDVEPEPQPVIDLEAGRQRVAQKRSQRPAGPSEKLARYFGRLGTSEGVTAPAGVNSIGAMAKAFAEWQREGVTRAEIRAMIDHYWSETYRTNRSSRLPAWQDFLAARAVLQDEGVRHQTESVRNRHQDDASFWSIPK